jgi:hypothetical protein
MNDYILVDDESLFRPLSLPGQAEDTRVAFRLKMTIVMLPPCRKSPGVGMSPAGGERPAENNFNFQKARAMKL